MAASFHIEHFGCRAARADGEAIADRLRAAGCCERQPAHADVVVVNTCSVTAEADRAARAFIRRAHRLNPEARIVATGCYAQRAPQELAALAGVAAVVGNSHKAFAPQIALNLANRPSLGKGTGFSPYIDVPPEGNASQGVHQFFPVQSLLATANPALILADDRFAHSFLEEAQLAPGAQTRPNLKIQEGCGNRCAFCVIPQTRGSSRSLPAPAVLRQVEGFVAAGGNELVLSGINLGRWGRDLEPSANPPRTFAQLVRQIIEQTNLPRLRLSSVEPMDWDADLIGLLSEFGETRLARHAHLPLQSGSDTVLRRMHRRYRPWHYAEKVAALQSAAGHGLTVGADVMVGFPGESDREFQETLDFIHALPFGYLHLFTFSPRPATQAWKLHAEHPVPPAAVEERMATLRALAAAKSQTHRTRFMGCALDAITLHTPPALAGRGRTSALTENFLPVEISAPLPANKMLRVQVRGLTTEGALQAKVAVSSLCQGKEHSLTPLAF
jgi:threonylcarbamoyladenosine tRNA methylthiotransferase MtaB